MCPYALSYSCNVNPSSSGEDPWKLFSHVKALQYPPLSWVQEIHIESGGQTQKTAISHDGMVVRESLALIKTCMCEEIGDISFTDANGIKSNWKFENCIFTQV